MNAREQITLASLLLSVVCVTAGTVIAVSPAVGMIVLGAFLFLVALLFSIDGTDA